MGWRPVQGWWDISHWRSYRCWLRPKTSCLSAPDRASLPYLCKTPGLPSIRPNPRDLQYTSEMTAGGDQLWVTEYDCHSLRGSQVSCSPRLATMPYSIPHARYAAAATAVMSVSTIGICFSSRVINPEVTGDLSHGKHGQRADQMKRGISLISSV